MALPGPLISFNLLLAFVWPQRIMLSELMVGFDHVYDGNREVILKKLGMVVMVLVLALMALPPGQPASLAQEPVEITFVHIFQDERDVRRETIQAVADAFMAANPGVTVTLESTTDDYGDLFEGALRAASQGNAPSVIQVEDSLVQIAIDSQMFVKMSDYASDEQKASLDDIIAPMRNFYNISADEFWALPWNASNPVMFYNPDMFEAAGLDPDDPPQTFDEILAACETLMGAGIEGLTACVNWPVNSWLPEQWVAMQNGLMVDNNNGRDGRPTEALLDSPELLNVFNWWKTLADNGYFTYTGTPNAYTSEGLLFVSRTTAIHITTSAAMSNLFNFAPTLGGFMPRVAPLPVPSEDDTTGITPGGAAVMVLAGNSEAETQMAVDFAFFLMNTENMAAWHKASGYFPVRQSSIDLLEEEGWFDENPYYRVPLDQLLAATPGPATAGMKVGASTQIREAVIQAALSVIDGGEDPAAALATAKERADSAIAEYNSLIVG